MDLTVSPDFDARICYGVAILIGILVGLVRVNSLLHNTRAAWLIPETWLLLFAYSLVPPLLFWMLDRTGAINDTSLFAAFLVAIAYQQIITGGYEGISAPANLRL